MRTFNKTFLTLFVVSAFFFQNVEVVCGASMVFSSCGDDDDDAGTMYKYKCSVEVVDQGDIPDAQVLLVKTMIEKPRPDRRWQPLYLGTKSRVRSINIYISNEKVRSQRLRTFSFSIHSEQTYGSNLLICQL